MNYLGRPLRSHFLQDIYQFMKINSSPTDSPSSEKTPSPLSFPWHTIGHAARTLGVSRPHVYNLIDRYGLRTVSLAEKGKTGSRFIDMEELANLMRTLADEQKGQPRICSQRKTRKVTDKGEMAS